jgi:hypothetical protein
MALVSSYVDLLRVQSQNFMGRHSKLQVNDIQKLDYISQKLLRNSFASTIDG